MHYIALEKDFSNADAILARLDDLDYLQGFADRAFQRLVQSGDYGYRSLGRLVQDVIAEQYPRRIDPNWVALRARGVRRATAPSTSSKSRSVRRLFAPAEKPTDTPLGYHDFIERGRPKAPYPAWRARLRYRIIGLALLYPIARREWRLTPPYYRRAILRQFGLSHG